MPKSRNRSRDSKKRAQKKRLKREHITRELAAISKNSTLLLNAAEKLRLQDEAQNNSNS